LAALCKPLIFMREVSSRGSPRRANTVLLPLTRSEKSTSARRVENVTTRAPSRRIAATRGSSAFSTIVLALANIRDLARA